MKKRNMFILGLIMLLSIGIMGYAEENSVIDMTLVSEIDYKESEWQAQCHLVKQVTPEK